MFAMMVTSAIAPAAVAIVSAIFAAIIALTDSIVNNYGECTIDINEGSRMLTVDGGASLLITLADQDLYIPSACGGRGTCGECKCKVVSDVGPHLPTELPFMDQAQLAENIRLACQIKVRADLGIAVPEHLFNASNYVGTVERIRDVTHDIKEVYIKLPEEISFRSGQYAQIEAPSYAKIKDDTQRAYSMSSRPGDKDHVEFLVRLVPEGIVTTYVHEHLEEGAKLRVIGPFGEFYVRDSDATMICVAGGSGMAPFKSIFHDFIENDRMGERDIWYFFGAVRLKDMYYIEELTELDRKYERFHFVPALSEPEPGTEWPGATGLITEVLDHYLADVISTDMPKEGYLCGSPGMLDACMAVMRTKHAMSEETIFFDKFA